MSRLMSANRQLEGGPINAHRSFHELVQDHVANDPAFAEALLCEGIEAMLSSDLDTGVAILDDFINAKAERFLKG
jgi:hypothetical protein